MREEKKRSKGRKKNKNQGVSRSDKHWVFTYRRNITNMRILWRGVRVEERSRAGKYTGKEGIGGCRDAEM